MKDMVLFEEALKEQSTGTSLTVQRLRFCTSTVGGMASIPGGGTKILHTTQCSQRGKKKKSQVQMSESKNAKSENFGKQPLILE